MRHCTCRITFASATSVGRSAVPQDDRPQVQKRNYLYYRHKLPVRIMHWINVVAMTILLHERAADLQRPSGALLGRVVRTPASRRSCDRRARAGRRPERGLYRASSGTTSTPPACSACRRIQWTRMRARGFPVVDDRSRHAMAVDGAHLAFLLRLDLRPQRARVSCSMRSSAGISPRDLVADRQRLRGIGASIKDHLLLPASEGRGGQALQRAAEARLSDRHLRACCR